MKFEWENILAIGTPHQATINLRAKVIGGWVLKNIYYRGKLRYENMVFIPDPKHEWSIDES